MIVCHIYASLVHFESLTLQRMACFSDINDLYLMKRVPILFVLQKCAMIRILHVSMLDTIEVTIESECDNTKLVLL